MSKGLEALERLYCAGNLQLDYVCNNKHKEDYDIIEKELKALEIIKAIKPFMVYENVGGKYYLETITYDVGLMKEEYELLKEVLL